MAIKNENISFSSVPDAPPGFPLLNNNNSQGASSSIRREQPNNVVDSTTINARRTTRKLTPPKPLYVPSPAPQVPTRRRGRPRKARSLASTPYSSYHQEGKVTNSKRKRIDSCVNKPPGNTAHSSMSRDHGIEQTNSPSSGYCRMEDPSCSNPPSHNFDSKNLQRVDQNHPALDLNTMLRSSELDENLDIILNTIRAKYGDITRNCLLESQYIKSFVLLGICKVVRDCQTKDFKNVDIHTLDSCYAAVRDAQQLKFDVQWLHNRLDEIRVAVKSRDELKAIVTERNTRMENSVVTKKKLELLKAEQKSVKRKKELLEAEQKRLEDEEKRIDSEVQELEAHEATDIVMVVQLNRTIDVQESKFSRFQQFSSLMDGLI